MYSGRAYQYSGRFPSPLTDGGTVPVMIYLRSICLTLGLKVQLGKESTYPINQEDMMHKINYIIELFFLVAKDNVELFSWVYSTKIINLYGSSASQTALCCTSLAMPAFLKQFQTVSAVTLFQAPVRIIIASKMVNFRGNIPFSTASMYLRTVAPQ